MYRFHILLCAFLVGVATGTIFSFSLATITWLFLIVGGVMIMFLRERVTPVHQLFFGAFCFIVFSLGLLRMEIASWSVGVSPLKSMVGETVEIKGVVIAEPDVRERTQHLKVRVDESTLLVTTDRFLVVSYGDEVVVQGELSIPESFTTELGREFHYEHHLLAQGIEYTVQFAEVSVLSSGNGNGVLAFLLLSKQRLLTGIETVIGEPQSGLGAGLLLGVKQALGDELEQTFRTAGIIHIVVLSGYNIMLVVAFVMFTLSFFFRKRARVIVGLLAVVAFALMVGLSATVVRASVMAALLLVAQALGRTYDVTRALLFAGTVMVFLNPYLLLYDIGFQLSFMATLGLVLLVPRFEAMVASGSMLVTAREYLLSTVATQIAVLPLLLYYIGEVSLVSVVVNLLVLPVVPLAMLATFVAGVGALISPAVATPCAFAAHYALSYIIEVATWFASVPFAAVAVPAFSVLWVLVLYVGMVTGYLFFFKTPATKHEIYEWVIEEEVKEKVEDSRSESSTIPVFFR